MILNINESIGKETVDRIASAINELKPGEKVFIYLSSEGGDPGCADAIIHIINNNVDLIEIVGYGDIMSSAFDIFFKSKCYRILLPGCMGMSHFGSVKMDTSESPASYETRKKADETWMKLQKEYTLKLCSDLKMTDKEISIIKRGKEAYFQYSRMLELLKTQEV